MADKHKGTYARPERDYGGELYPEEMGEQSVYDDEVERKLAGTKRGTTSVDRKAAKVGTLANELADAISEEREKQSYIQPYGPPGTEGKPYGDTSKINVRTKKAREDLAGAQEEHYTALQAAQEAVEHHQRTVALNAGPNASPEGAEGPSDGFVGMAADRLEKEMDGYNGASATRVRNLARMQSMQTQIMHSIGMEGEHRTRARIMDLQEAYDEAIVDLGSLRVDPKRWEEDTPAVAQVLMALASSAFAFFSGGQGPNPIVQLIDKAIDRDVKAQMSSINSKMRATGLGLEKEEALAKMEAGLTSSMYQRVMNVTESMMQESQLLGQSEDMVNAHTAIMQRGLEVEMKRLKLYADIRERAAKQQALGGSEPVKWDDPKAGEQITASTQGIDALDRIYDLYNETSFWGKRHVESVLGSSWSPLTTDEGVYNEQKGGLGITMAKAAAGFQVSEADRQAFEVRLPGIKDTRSTAHKKMALLLADSVKKAVKTYEKASPNDRARIAADVRRGLQRARQWVEEHPEILEDADKPTLKYIQEILGQ